MRPVRFSHCYGVARSADDDWFDPLLTQDTRLFVDPFLIFMDTQPRWANAHARVMDFFNMALKLLASSGFSESSSRFAKAKALLVFPEPPEFCLGMARNSIFGSGSARGLQRGMLKGAREAIELGMESVRHLEEIALLGEQMGPDRISDMTCDVLKGDFIRYTQEVAERHGVPMQRVPVRHADWDPRFEIWSSRSVELPLNPVASRIKDRPVGVILVPERFLRRMPTVDPGDFWDFAWASEAEELRGQFNYEVGRNVDRGEIARLARQRRRLLTKYLESLAAKAPDPYPVGEDPALVVSPPDFAIEVADAFVVARPTSREEFASFVEALIENFKHCVEQRGAWRTLWTGGEPRPEKHVQALFDVSAVMACQDRDVELTRESDAGRGPVDFKFSRGKELRALLEVKLAKSSSFKRNLERQVKAYAQAEGCEHAYFVAIQYRDQDCDPEFVQAAEDIASKVAQESGMTLRVIWVDARHRPSASRL